MITETAGVMLRLSCARGVWLSREARARYSAAAHERVVRGHQDSARAHGGVFCASSAARVRALSDLARRARKRRSSSLDAGDTWPKSGYPHRSAARVAPWRRTPDLRTCRGNPLRILRP